MRRLESILNYLHNKGWDIKEADTKTLTAYVCKKINTTMEIAFVDKNDHTIKRKDETTVIDAIKIKSVKVDKNVSIPRKDDMLNELIYFSKQRRKLTCFLLYLYFLYFLCFANLLNILEHRRLEYTLLVKIQNILMLIYILAYLLIEVDLLYYLRKF